MIGHHDRDGLVVYTNNLYIFCIDFLKVSVEKSLVSYSDCNEVCVLVKSIA